MYNNVFVPVMLARICNFILIDPVFKLSDSCHSSFIRGATKILPEGGEAHLCTQFYGTPRRTIWTWATRGVGSSPVAAHPQKYSYVETAWEARLPTVGIRVTHRSEYNESSISCSIITATNFRLYRSSLCAFVPSLFIEVLFIFSRIGQICIKFVLFSARYKSIVSIDVFILKLFVSKLL